MITNEIIEDFIQKIPPSPKALKATILLLNQGELAKAAQIAQTDLALSAYLKNIVNKPIYGFKNEVAEVSQIFGILGLSSSQQTVYNYMMTLLSPKKWELFKLRESTFHELQAKLSRRWKQILEHLEIDDMAIESSITLLPASIIVAEALFNEKKTDVDLLRSVNNLDLNTILGRLCSLDLFDICEKIALKWEMPSSISQIIQASSGFKASDDEKLNRLGKWMHLLLFYELSQPLFIEAELNDFIDFKIDYVSEIYDDFATLMEIT
ncbi:MAG: HDOD domain-containing protein [Sulfurimonas sp.]|nr:HDOD domain-containing protein [Sulfurimonas sp.]MDQ7062351.1 HDOD domain-containing protein [Sulfurimonas sp.]